jgi:hypothetical protein
MLRTTLCAAIAAATLSLAAPVQAMPVDSGLNTAAPVAVQQVAYWDYHRRHRGRYGWRHSYAYSPYHYRHRHCWSVRTWNGWVRRCSW